MSTAKGGHPKNRSQKCSIWLARKLAASKIFLNWQLMSIVGMQYFSTILLFNCEFQVSLHKFCESSDLLTLAHALHMRKTSFLCEPNRIWQKPCLTLNVLNKYLELSFKTVAVQGMLKIISLGRQCIKLSQTKENITNLEH